MADPSLRALTDADLQHEGPHGIESPAMRRGPMVPGAARLPMGMDAYEAFGIDNEGEPLNLDGGEFDGMQGDFLDQEMTEDELLTLLDEEERDAIDFASASIAQERADAMDYFFGRPFGNEEDGRSQAISTEVFDAVEQLLPSFLKPFVSSDDVVAFEPTSEADVKACEQETAFIQHQFMRKNPGFQILYNNTYQDPLQWLASAGCS